MPARTFFALLSEGYKRQVKNYRMIMALNNSPYMEEDDKSNLVNSLTLPEDVLSGIIEDENTTGNIEDLKNIL